jgi:phosphatidylinositol-3-phosphatase
VPNGTHTIVATAVDPAGNWGTSASVSFTVANAAGDTTAPTVAVTSPAAGATLAGTVTLSANASDDVSVTQVKWYVDGSEVAWDGNGAPWQASWNSATVADGQHTIFAKAADAAGNWGASAILSFSVSNAAPPPPPSGAPCGTVSAPPATWDHVVWIVFENKTYAQIIGSANAPYINLIAQQCGSASNFSAEAHPSLPNYIAMTSGSTQGITDDSDPSAHPLDAASIFAQLGTDWRSLQESMPSNCALSNSGQYAVRHNPAAYYTNIRTACQAQDVPLASTPDLSARFTFITPDLCHDMHSSSCGSDTATEVKNGDTWLSGFLPKVLGSSQYQAGRTAVFITWDEDDYSSTQHIATLVVAPSIPAGTTVASTFNHYSMLRSTEEMLAIGTYPGGADGATSMRSGFHL